MHSHGKKRLTLQHSCEGTGSGVPIFGQIPSISAPNHRIVAMVTYDFFETKAGAGWARIKGAGAKSLASRRFPAVTGGHFSCTIRMHVCVTMNLKSIFTAGF